ncbi:MAG: hypothetical protein QMB37_07180 [Paludibacteraceae bacterium]
MTSLCGVYSVGQPATQCSPFPHRRSRPFPHPSCGKTKSIQKRWRRDLKESVVVIPAKGGQVEAQ